MTDHRFGKVTLLITVEHVERLLASEDPDAALVLVGGRPEIVRAGEDGPGGLLVADRQDVLRRLEESEPSAAAPSAAALEKVAQALDLAVSKLGG